MKRLSTTILLLAAVTVPFANLQSQSAPTPAQPMTAQVITINIVAHLKSPITELQGLKAANQALLDQQAKTLQALDELQKQAEELKVFGKRS